MLQDVKSYLGRSFAMKDLGDAAYILGIKIYRDRSKRLIGLNQSAYIKKILKRFYMENSKRGMIPMQEKLKLSKSQGASTPAEKQRMQNIPYASAIGSIMYDVRCTRPNVAFAQNMRSRFQQNPGEEHWTAVKNIPKYLRNTKDMFLVYGAIAIAKDDGVTKGARHFRAKVHYLRETIKMGDVRIEKIDTDDNLADPFTKALAFPKHSELTRNIGLVASYRASKSLFVLKKDSLILYLLSIKIAHDIFARAQFLESKPVITPLSTSIYFTRHDIPYYDLTHYRSLVNAFQYLTIIRPDLSYAVNQLTDISYQEPFLDAFYEIFDPSFVSDHPPLSLRGGGALEWLLEEINVTWAHLEKKQTRLRLYTKSLEEIIIQTVETASPALATASKLGVRSITMASECSRLK
ncbi:retrotransposon protein, putative, ty1-copia subclass [Tanacetum coccineum]|uniref:Retrotransposon protein, putative, ty1-copia subclass n=1 Tax=Tanacetum coccineum TaxID=301880 RepID=A0ABQ4Z489_9ASTR